MHARFRTPALAFAFGATCILAPMAGFAQAPHATPNPPHPHGHPSPHAPVHAPVAGSHGAAPRPKNMWVRPAPPIPFLPTIAKIRVAVGVDDVVITHDVTLPRGDYRGGELRFFVAFGAPGVPRALDAHLLLGHQEGTQVGAQTSDANGSDVSNTEALPYERAPRAMASDYTLLGHEQVAGVVIKITEAQFRKATERDGVATLHIRSALPKPGPEEGGVRSLVLRLGALKDQGPLTLLRIESTAARPLQSASAALCGPDADPFPLSVLAAPPLRTPVVGDRVAPAFAVRHPRDSLCFRWSE